MKNFLFSAALAAILCVAFFSCSCSRKESMEDLTHRVMERAIGQFSILDGQLGDNEFPKTFEDGENVNSDPVWWCSGFFPGSLWYVYEATGNEDVKALAEKNTLKLSGIVGMPTHHDIGFQTNSSFGNAYRITGDESYLPVIESAAAKLATRFNPVVGCIRSWDNPEYIYPVIIDNMMNLELLVNAADLFDCDSLRQIACTHANTTIRNHFREDNSSYHLVDYIPQTGEIDHKQTVQGLADDSSWSRGQSWGLYGYAMMYDRTGVDEYLAQAEKVARYILGRLPEDGMPAWDFDAEEPALKDASAAAVMASGFLTLASCTQDAKLAEQCKVMAETQIRSLASDEYLAQEGEQGGFLIKHCVGNLPKMSEVDVPLTYADYYFLEAIVKYSRL